jgi:hypothetical protein
MMMTQRRVSEDRASIERGQRYQEARAGYLGRPAPVWIVEKTFTACGDDLRYAHLICAADPTLRKTLALDALSDTKRFRRIAETDQSAAARDDGVERRPAGMC